MSLVAATVLLVSNENRAGFTGISPSDQDYYSRRETNMPRATRTHQLALSAAFLGLVATSLTGCGSDDETEEREFSFYCTTEDGTVQPDDKCDDDGDGHGHSFFYVGYPLYTSLGGPHATLTPGQKVPVTAGAPRFQHNDAGARAKWGLPATGRISNGTTKTGIVGKGGAVSGKAGAATKGGAGG